MSTFQVEEDIGLIQYARNIFMDQHGSCMVPTLSGNSTSNPITHTGNNTLLQIKRERYIGYTNVQPRNLNPEAAKRCEIDDDDDQSDTECASDLEANNECRHAPPNFVSNEQATPNTGSSEMMRVEVSARARHGCSSYADEQTNMQMDCQNTDAQTSCLQRQDGSNQWNLLYENLCSGFLDPSGILFECRHLVTFEN